VRLDAKEKVIQTMPLNNEGGKATLLGNKTLDLTSKSAASWYVIATDAKNVNPCLINRE